MPSWMREPTDKCPCCGGQLPGSELQWLTPQKREPRHNQYASGILVGSGKALVLTRTESAIFDVLWTARHMLEGMSRDAIVERIWRDRADGGPNYQNVVNQYVYHIRAMIEPFGITIKSTGGRTSTTRLVGVPN